MPTILDVLDNNKYDEDEDADYEPSSSGDSGDERHQGSDSKQEERKKATQERVKQIYKSLTLPQAWPESTYPSFQNIQIDPLPPPSRNLLICETAMASTTRPAEPKSFSERHIRPHIDMKIVEAALNQGKPAETINHLLYLVSSKGLVTEKLVRYAGTTFLMQVDSHVSIQNKSDH